MSKKKKSKLKLEELFSASSFRNVILQKVIARWSKKIFYFMKFDIEDIKSYPSPKSAKSPRIRRQYTVDSHSYHHIRRKSSTKCIEGEIIMKK